MDNRNDDSPVPEQAPQKPGHPMQKRTAGQQSAAIVTLILSVAMLAALAYAYHDHHRSQLNTAAEMSRLSGQLQTFDTRGQESERRISEIESQMSDALKTVGAAHKELVKKTRQFQLETRRTKAELQVAIGSKADATQIEALKQEADSKFETVSNEVGGVKSEVGTVRTDLASTRRDLDGTQRQLMDVRETLTAAVARNSTELAALRAKGERDYFEFSIPRKKYVSNVGDIQLVLTKTDPKKGRYNVKVIADDNQLEKKDRTINEPVQFLVGRNLVRYELVVNWVQKDRIGGYLSVPKDKSLAAERIQTAKGL